MLQAAALDRHFLDLFPFSDDGFVTSKIDVSGCDVAQALVVALMVVVLGEGLDLLFEIARQEVVLQQHAVLQGLVPALDLILRLQWNGKRKAVIARPVARCAESPND